MGLQVKQIGDKLFPYLNEITKYKFMELCFKEERKLIRKEGEVLYSDLENTLKQLA